MNSYNDWKQVVRRNKMLGIWAAEKLAVGTLDPERSDMLRKIRKDFDAAGVMQ